MRLIGGIIAGIVSLVVLTAVLLPITDGSADKTLDVLIIDGQSNAEYGDLSVCDPSVLNADYPDAPAHNIYYYGTSSAPANQWDWHTKWGYSWTAFHVYNAYDYNSHEWIIGGYEPILGNTISQKSGNDVLVVNMAIGARTIDDLLPDGADGDYSWGVLNHALDELSPGYGRVNMIGVVWIQGESDNSTPVADYKESFVELMDSFEKYGASEFYLVHTRDYYGGNSNIAQDELAQEYPNVHMTTRITETFTVENGMLDPGNPIHYNQAGRDAISDAIKDKIIIPAAPIDPVTELLQTIPMLVIAGLIIAIVGTIVIRRSE